MAMQPCKPKITYGHGFLDDCTDDTQSDWTQISNSWGGITFSVVDDDVFKFNCTSGDAGVQESATYENSLSVSLSTSVYTRYYVRWKTSVASQGAGLVVYAKYSDNSVQYLVGTNTSTPAFSTTWTVNTGTLTTGKTLTDIVIIVVEDDGSLSSGTTTVYVDFILIVKDRFTFPHAENAVFTPPPRYAQLKIPLRVGDILQMLGLDSAVFQCSCNLDVGDWKRSGDTVNGEVFMDIVHNSQTEPWQWLDTDLGQQFKAVLDEPEWHFDGQNHRVDLLFREFRRKSADDETYKERWGIS